VMKISEYMMILKKAYILNFKRKNFYMINIVYFLQFDMACPGINKQKKTCCITYF